MNEPVFPTVKEEITVDKYEGNTLVERITMVDGVITKVETFADGGE